MKSVSRRQFISTGAAGALIATTGIGCSNSHEKPSSQVRNHPLDGISREKLKITDVKVTLLSAEIPPEEQWYLDWVPERYKAWKADSILVEVFTDVGIRGIGGATQYGGPAAVKNYIEKKYKAGYSRTKSIRY